MKVAFDISKMNKLSRTRGIGVYATNLYDSLKKYTDISVELIEDKTDYARFDLIHYPYFDIFSKTLPFRKIKPTVITVHDLIPIQFSEHYPPGIKGKINWSLQKIALKNVTRIIAVSETVKKDIINILKIAPDKISVVYSAPAANFRKITDKKILDKIRTKYNLPDEFVLYIGNTNWNKNILNMTEAVLSAGKNLVIVGGAFLERNNLDHPEMKSMKKWIEKYGNNDLVQALGFVELEDIVGIMNLASCKIFVSYYEGFGLPILEAQACGLPVITSKVSATAEIAGEGGVLMDPEDIQSIKQVIVKIFENREYRKHLVEKGNDNLKRFSWRETAIKTVKVYEDILR